MNDFKDLRYPRTNFCYPTISKSKAISLVLRKRCSTFAVENSEKNRLDIFLRNAKGIPIATVELGAEVILV